MQESLADEVCKINCTGQALTADGFPYKVCCILYCMRTRKSKSCAQQHKKAAGAFCKVYKNDDIFKDLIKLLYASGQSQQDMA